MSKRTPPTDCVFEQFVGEKMVEKRRARMPYVLDGAITSRCRAGCIYCLTSSIPQSKVRWDRERTFRLIDECAELEMGLISWSGGDPLEHPDLFDFISYGIDKGFDNSILSPGFITKREAKRTTAIDPGETNLMVTIHIDTIDQKVYNQVHRYPSTLQERIQGYRNLLEAGFPPEQIGGIITLTQPVMDTVEETVDWYIDEMGTSYVMFCGIKPVGFASGRFDLECSKDELMRVCEYRAKKCGEHWNLIGGSTEVGAPYCDTQIAVVPDGSVGPCPTLRDPQFFVGNIYEESLVDIFKKYRDSLLFNFDIEGRCGECNLNKYCRGCRGSAYYGSGDVRGSDPKCYFNPQNPQYAYVK